MRPWARHLPQPSLCLLHCAEQSQLDSGTRSLKGIPGATSEFNALPQSLGSPSAVNHNVPSSFLTTSAFQLEWQSRQKRTFMPIGPSMCRGALSPAGGTVPAPGQGHVRSSSGRWFLPSSASPFSSSSQVIHSSQMRSWNDASVLHKEGRIPALPELSLVKRAVPAWTVGCISSHCPTWPVLPGAVHPASRALSYLIFSL